MALSDDLERIAAAAAALAAPGEQVAGVLAAEPDGAGRVYLCAFESATGQEWIALDADAQPVGSRRAVREAVSLAALCEVAEELAGGGNLAELRDRLAELRAVEAPEGIEAAEAAAEALESTLQPEPRLATAAYLDALGSASRRLERTLSDDAGSPFAAAMQQALPAIEELAAQIEARYRLPLS